MGNPKTEKPESGAASKRPPENRYAACAKLGSGNLMKIGPDYHETESVLDEIRAGRWDKNRGTVTVGLFDAKLKRWDEVLHKGVPVISLLERLSDSEIRTALAEDAAFRGEKEAPEPRKYMWDDERKAQVARLRTGRHGYWSFVDETGASTEISRHYHPDQEKAVRACRADLARHYLVKDTAQPWEMRRKQFVRRYQNKLLVPAHGEAKPLKTPELLEAWHRDACWFALAAGVKLSEDAVRKDYGHEDLFARLFAFPAFERPVHSIDYSRTADGYPATQVADTSESEGEIDEPLIALVDVDEEDEETPVGTEPAAAASDYGPLAPAESSMQGPEETDFPLALTDVDEEEEVPLVPEQPAPLVIPESAGIKLRNLQTGKESAVALIIQPDDSMVCPPVEHPDQCPICRGHYAHCGCDSGAVDAARKAQRPHIEQLAAELRSSKKAA